MVRYGWGVAAAALVAVLGRFPSLLWPLRPDEAGFLLVARAWDPEPGSLYGHYWVDRPPQLLAVVRAADAIGGPYFLRLVAAFGCGLAVLAATAAAREVARHAGVVDARAQGRAATWTAVVTAAFLVNAEIDAVAAKGELLAVPLVLGSCWLALRALRLQSVAAAAAAGLLAMLAVGMKQNLVGALVFGAVLLVGGRLAGRLSWPAFARLAAAALAGAAVPVAATVAWTVAAGVRLETLAYAVIGFRSDASQVIVSQDASGAMDRTVVIAAAFLGTGMALVAFWFGAHLPRALNHLPAVAVAVACMLAVDVAGVVLGGSFWLPYLFALVPPLALGVAVTLARHELEDEHPVLPLLTRTVVAVTVLSAVMSLAWWANQWRGGSVPHEYVAGRAIAAAADPGDTLMVYGGRPDLQWASGRPSPYPYLWSLPMRTLDHGRDELEALLTGPRAPTWFVEAVSLDTWSELGTRPIERSLLHRYEFVGSVCDRYRVYHLNTLRDIDLDLSCDAKWRRTVLGEKFR